MRLDTWNADEQTAASHILSGFETNLSREETSQRVISPLLEPTVQQKLQVRQRKKKKKMEL